MSTRTSTVAGLILALSLVVTGCGSQPAPSATPRVAASEFNSAFIGSLLKRAMQKEYKKAFAHQDRNGDGVVTREEVPFLQPETFQKLDRNGDGRVTFDESAVPKEQADAAVSQMRQEMASGFTGMDRNRDGQLDPQETRYGDSLAIASSSTLKPADFVKLLTEDPDETPAVKGTKNPVLILPGCISPAFPWIPIRIALKRRGYTQTSLLMAWPWLGNIREYAHMAKYEFDQLLLKSPTGKVDLMAHSMGGLIGRSMMQQFRNTSSVDHFITYGTPHHGSVLAHLFGWGFTAIDMMKPNSDFIQALNADDETPEGIKCTSIKGLFDELVIPHKSADWDGAEIKTIHTSAHLLMIMHPTAVKWGMEALEK